MPKFAMIFAWGVVLSCLVAGVFFIKYEVIRLENNLAVIEKKIDRTATETQVLRAEWSFLNNPNRLRILADKYLKHLSPPKAFQITTANSFFDKKDNENLENNIEKNELKTLSNFKEISQ